MNFVEDSELPLSAVGNGLFQWLWYTMLDPQFGLSWVHLDVNNGENVTSVMKLRDQRKKSLTDLLISEVEKRMSSASDSGAMNVDPPSDSPVKCPHLLSRYKARKKRSSTTQDSSIETQISKYFDAIHDTDTDTDNALAFWAENHDRLTELHSLAMKVLSVPASSAPEESLVEGEL
ncbi:unnamed protein product [Leuciscus chuanchicus]